MNSNYSQLLVLSADNEAFRTSLDKRDTSFRASSEWIRVATGVSCLGEFLDRVAAEFSKAFGPSKDRSVLLGSRSLLFYSEGFLYYLRADRVGGSVEV